MPEEINLEKVGLIKGIRDGGPVTRARVQAITLALLNGPPALRTDQRKNFSITCAYVILRPTLYRKELGAYRRKHTIHSKWICRVEKAISEGKVSFIDGEFVRDKPQSGPRVGRHQKLFDEVIDLVDDVSSVVGRIDLDTIRRLMFVKHHNPADDNEQIVLKALQLPSGHQEAWASFVTLTTVRRLLQAYSMACEAHLSTPDGQMGSQGRVV